MICFRNHKQTLTILDMYTFVLRRVNPKQPQYSTSIIVHWTAKSTLYCSNSAECRVKWLCKQHSDQNVLTCTICVYNHCPTEKHTTTQAQFNLLTVCHIILNNETYCLKQREKIDSPFVKCFVDCVCSLQLGFATIYSLARYASRMRRR